MSKRGEDLVVAFILAFALLYSDDFGMLGDFLQWVLGVDVWRGL